MARFPGTRFAAVPCVLLCRCATPTGGQTSNAEPWDLLQREDASLMKSDMKRGLDPGTGVPLLGVLGVSANLLPGVPARPARVGTKTCAHGRSAGVNWLAALQRAHMAMDRGLGRARCTDSAHISRHCIAGSLQHGLAAHK